MSKTYASDKATIKPAGLTITVPEGALCALYPGAPSSKNYFDAIDIKNALPCADITTVDGRTAYYYANLKEGLYHCTGEMDGYYAVCQIVNYTAQKAAVGAQVDLHLDKLAGNGYEVGYVMLNTQEFIDAQLASEKDTWGQKYAGLFNTPQFLRADSHIGRHQQTTNEELMDFVAELDKNNKNMYVFSLGKSPKYGYDMPLILFTKENVDGMTLAQAAKVVRGNSKPTIQYIAQCHSSEPASTEGALATMLALCGDYGKRVLDTVDVYIIPRINLDGAREAIRRSPTTGDDMNRDYLLMNNTEIRLVTGAYNLFLPEVAIDGHEKGNDVLTTGASICTDMELQVGAGSINHPAIMTQTAMEMALTALSKAKAHGLRGHFYTKFASAAGGYAGSSYFGTRNSLSFLVETPGQVHLGMLFMERRVMAHYLLASSIIDYTVIHAREIVDTVRASREYMTKTGAIYDENNVIVLEHGKEETGRWSTPLINVPTGKVTEPEHSVAYSEHVVAVRTRPRPTAYIIPVGTAHEDEILRVVRNHAIDYYQLSPGSTISAKQYVQGKDEISLSKERPVSFPQGAFVFPNTVSSTILGAIMEPDFHKDRKNSTLFTMGLIESDADGYLPIYRYCHDLQNGKIPAGNTME